MAAVVAGVLVSGFYCLTQIEMFFLQYESISSAELLSEQV